jgi:DNA-binding GntR family transcriptional regulator
MESTSTSDDHGRHLTTSPDAAEWYRRAQRVAHHRDEPSAALRRAIEADPGFALAVADLDALSGTASMPRSAQRISIWERHHREIVVATANGHVGRAITLLREHLSEVGCDPLALRVVGDAVTDDSVDDLRRNQPGCHAVDAAAFEAR